MSTLLLTFVWAVLIVIGAVALFALAWYFTGRWKKSQKEKRDGEL